MAEIVYIFRAENGLYKVGIADNLRERLRSLNIASPIEISFIYAAEVHDRAMVEKIVHKKINQYRKRGEWFEFPDDYLDEVKKLIGGNPVNLCTEEKRIKVGQYTIIKLCHRNQYSMQCPHCLSRNIIKKRNTCYFFKCRYCELNLQFSEVK